MTRLHKIRELAEGAGLNPMTLYRAILAATSKRYGSGRDPCAYPMTLSRNTFDLFTPRRKRND